MKHLIVIFFILVVVPYSLWAQKKTPLLKKVATYLDSAAIKSGDTTYIAVPRQPWQFMLKGNVNQSSLKMKARGELLGEAYAATPKLRTEPAQYVGFWAGYRGHGFGYTVNVAGDKGSYFTLSSTGQSYGVNLRIHSFTNNRPNFGLQSTLIPEEYIDDWDKVKLVDPIHVRTVIADGYYLFNGRRFSHAAAYDYSVVQKRSAGSLMVGAMMYYGHINYATHTNADLIYMMGGLGEVKLYQGGLGAGYAYNWVPTRGLIVNVMAMPTLTFINKIKAYGYNTNVPELAEDPRFMDEDISDEEWDAWWDSSKRISYVANKTFSSGLSLDFDARLSVVYNFNRYFISANGQFNTFHYKHNNTRGRLNDWYVNAALGIRL